MQYRWLAVAVALGLATACIEHDASTLAASLSVRSDGLPPTASLVPSQDTSIYEHSPDNAGGNDPEIWIAGGGTGQLFRGLLQFAVDASVPAGATVTRVDLTMEVVIVPGMTPQPSNLELFRVLEPWDEGTAPGGVNLGNACSTYGGATWNTQDCSNSWSTAGGEVFATPSASVAVGTTLETLVWTSDSNPTLIQDVQSWLDDPTSNFGWLLRSDAESTAFSARRLASRENLSATVPTLDLVYELGSGDSCGANDECSSGNCVLGTCCATACDSPDAQACQQLPVVSCSDGTTCTYSAITPGTPCMDDGEPCTDDVCGTIGICEHIPTSMTCDDGDPCTLSDDCTTGTCAGTPMSCDDGDPCTDDVCEGGSCSSTTHTRSCDDSDPCTEADSCIGGVCMGTPLDCDDGETCTTDTCMGGACQNAPRDGACDDGSVCTIDDTCQGGVCVSGTSPCGTRECEIMSASTFACTCPPGFTDDGTTCVANSSGCQATPAYGPLAALLLGFGLARRLRLR